MAYDKGDMVVVYTVYISKNKLRLPPHVSSRDDSINSVSFLCTESLCRKETAPNKLDIASD